MPSFRTVAGVGLLAGSLGLLELLRPAPRRLSLLERLADLPERGLPLRRDVTVFWDDRAVPFIEADDDRDLATAFGVVHAHLRLGQMETLRRISQGRVAEMAGPAAIELDHVLRAIDFGRAVPPILDRLPDGTRVWLDGFVDGVNAYLSAATRLPREFAAFGLAREPWTVADVLTLSRLAAADFTWTVWVRLLRHSGRADWPSFWRRAMAGRTEALPVPSFAGHGRPSLPPPASGRAAGALDAVLGWVGRSGSNSVAVAAARSATGGALLASDPHLSVLLPNLWVLAGGRSPGFHAVGFMVPGVPVVALGRNPWIGWGGTSLHAASSDLFDVTDLPPHAFSERPERIRVRWWPDRTLTIRESPQGPVVSDAALLGAPSGRALALRWIGHRPSDEITALLGVNRARDWPAFRAALDGFAAPAQTMIYADAGGRVGLATAAHLPRRPPGPPGGLLAEPGAAAGWDDIVTASSLRAVHDPPEGFVASANDRPPDGPVPVGYFFSPDDRVRRLRTLLGGPGRIGVDELTALQRDVLVPSAKLMAERLLGVLRQAGQGRTRLADALAGWDGRYGAESAGALAFELLSAHFLQALHGDDLRVYAALWDPWALIREDLATMPPDRLTAAMAQAAGIAGEGLARHGVWGRAHRLRLRHVLGLVPGAGRRYRFADLAAAGGNETVMKTAHGFSTGRHAVAYGSQARHVSDFADPDRNLFCLLGGQDGMIGSTNFLDQLGPWRRGEYVRLPLRPETVRATFPHRSVLRGGPAVPADRR